ncbi:MAG: CBS domain-containing protein [Candidatus Azotimanducaceae bacterium]|jgi:CBS domain-containing protein
MLGSVELSDYMIKNPVTARAELTVYEAALRILEHKVSGLVVVDERKALIGMLSELDCLRVILAGVYNDEEFGTALVGDVMIRNVESQHPTDDIVDVATSMLDHKHRRRPVVDDEGLLVGQVTCRQILKVMTEGLKKQKRR